MCVSSIAIYYNTSRRGSSPSAHISRDWHFSPLLFDIFVSFYYSTNISYKALRRIRRHIPDRLVQQLRVIRFENPYEAVQEEANDALAEILSLEPMEDKY